MAQNSKIKTLDNEKAWISLNVGTSKEQNKEKSKEKSKESSTATKSESFKEPVKVTLDLGKIDVKDTSKLTLVKYVQKEDGTVEMIKLGGTYDPETGSFSSYVTGDGDFGVVVDEDIVQVKLQVADKTEDGKENANAPKMVNGEMTLPLRYVAESLGAQVVWDNKTKKTAVVMGDKKIIIEKEDIASKEGGKSFVSTEVLMEKLGVNMTVVPSTNEMIIVK